MRRRPTLLLLGAGLLQACRPRPPELVEPSTPSAVVVAARLPRSDRASVSLLPSWRFYPTNVDVSDAIQLDDGRWVLAGTQGERWIASIEDGRTVADAVPSLAPVGLRYISRPASGLFRFVGENGEVFDSRDPAGPLTLVARPARALSDFAGRRDVLLGLDGLGAVMRFDGAGWTDVSVEAPLFHIADSKGVLLALSYPERLFRADGTGETWSALQTPPVGAFGLTPTRDGEILVDTISGQHRLAPTGLLERVRPSDAKVDVGWSGIHFRRGPSVLALNEGRASLTSNEFAELSTLNDEGALRPFVLHARLGDHGIERPITLPAMGTCRALRFAGRGLHWVVGCQDAATLSLTVTHDRGETWSPIETADVDFGDESALVMGPSGTALLLANRACAEGACLELSRISRAGGHLERVTTPQFSLHATGTAFGSVAGWLSWSSERPVVLAPMKKRGLIPFVSDDDGKTFRPIDLFARGARGSKFVRDFIDVANPAHRSATVGQDGTLSVVLGGRHRRGALLTSDGEVVGVVDPSKLGEVIAVSGVGRRWLAIVRDKEAPRLLGLWQTLDGGASFERLRPPAPIRVLGGEASPLHCVEAGCLVGAEFVRVGWGRDERAVEDLQTESPNQPARRSVRTAIRCKPKGAQWTPLNNVDEGALPTAEDAFRGKTVWSLLVREPDGASAVVSAGGSPPEGKTELRRDFLFAPRGPARMAERIDAQAEGWVGVRAVTSQDAGMRFDVSWVDLLAERRGQGTIWTPVARPEAFGAGFRPFLHGVDATITRRGVMVRLNGVEEAYTLDFDGQKTGPIAFASWPSVPLDRVESAIDDGRPRAVALHLGKSGSVRTVSVAEPTDGVRVDKGVAPPSSPSRDVTTHWSRYGGRPGVVVHLLQPDRGRGVAYFTEVAATSEPARTMPVPTQHDLHEPYRPCTEEIIASSPRVIAPFFAGSRHPVVIDGDVEPMMTSDAVLYGTVESPCLLGWVADGARPGTTRAFIPADRGTGWLLRISRDRKAGVDAIPLQCASAGAGEPPDWIENFAATESVE